MSLPPETPDLAVLDLLVSVAETGSLGEAARRHGISQPAASMRISALERRLRLVLLERGPTGSRLTTAGASVVQWAMPVLAAARALLGGVAALHAEGSGRLRIAASMTVADHRVPGWLITLRTREPETKVALEVGNSQQVADLVRGGAHLGFVEGPHAPAGLRSRVVGGDELVVVVAPSHPWARLRRPLPFAELAATPLILRERGSGTREALWRVLLREAGEPVAPSAELGSAAAIKAAAAAGGAPAVVSRLVVTDELRDGRLVSVPPADPSLLRRRFRAIWRRETPPSGPAATLLAIASGR